MFLKVIVTRYYCETFYFSIPSWTACEISWHEIKDQYGIIMTMKKEKLKVNKKMFVFIDLSTTKWWRWQYPHLFRTLGLFNRAYNKLWRSLIIFYIVHTTIFLFSFGLSLDEQGAHTSQKWLTRKDSSFKFLGKLKRAIYYTSIIHALEAIIIDINLATCMMV